MKRGALVAGIFTAILWLSSALAGAHAAASPATPRTAVDRALAIVQSGENGTPAQRARSAQEALAALDSDSSLARDYWLREPLLAQPPDLTQAATRLTATAALLTEPSVSTLDSTVARASLRDVLADSRFHPRTLLSFVPGWLVPVALIIGSIVQFLLDFVLWPINQALSLLERLLNAFVQSPAFGPVVFGVIVVVIGGLVFLYQKALRATVIAQAEIESPSEALPPTAVDALTHAQIRANEGRYREACHYVFLSSLLWVEEQTGFSLDRAATNREQLDRLKVAQLPRAASLAAGLAPVVRRFDRIWYGQAATGDADYRDLLTLAARLREVVE